MKTLRQPEAQIGDAVFCRDQPNRSWLSGVIASLEPLQIQVQGWPIAMSFNFVRQTPLVREPETDRELKLETYLLGEYRFNVGSFVRKELDRSSEIIKNLDKGDVVDVISFKIHDSRIRAEIKDGGFVTLYNFIDKREIASYKSIVVEKACAYEHFPKDKIGHLLGKEGKAINAIRKKSRAKIKIFDEQTRTIDDENVESENRYSCLVQITGSPNAVAIARLWIRQTLARVQKYEAKQGAWKIRKLQKQFPHSDYWGYNPYGGKPSFTGMPKQDLTGTIWEMQKLQHGANGSWFTRKHKNKGKRRGNKPKGPHFLRQDCQKMRKPNRKYFIELPNNRRFSL